MTITCPHINLKTKRMASLNIEITIKTRKTIWYYVLLLFAKIGYAPVFLGPKKVMTMKTYQNGVFIDKRVIMVDFKTIKIYYK